MAVDWRKSPTSIVEERRVPEAGGQEGQGKVKAERNINYSTGVIKHLSEGDTKIFVLIMTLNNAVQNVWSTVLVSGEIKITGCHITVYVNLTRFRPLTGFLICIGAE